MRVLIISKKIIILVLIIVIIIIGSLFVPHSISSNSPKGKYTVVLDAGHGGVDGGAVGKKLIEKEINLILVNKLEKYLKAYGMKVVLTRIDNDGLYNESADSLKKSDMKERSDIINECNADMVISIHQNSFSTKSLRGAQCFYQQGSVLGKELADTIQNQLVNKLPYARKSSNFGDYYILNCSNAVSVLIECAFITNPIEEQLLETEDYQDRICYSIFCGIVKYFENNN